MWLGILMISFSTLYIFGCIILHYATSHLFHVGCLQLTFVFLVFPCLLLGYLGQAAYLMQNQGDYAQSFYSSVPSKSYSLLVIRSC